MDRNKVPLSSIPPENVRYVLKMGSLFVDGRIRIYENMKHEKIASKRQKFIKDEYGIGGFYGHTEGRSVCGFNTFNSKGIYIQWDDNTGENETYLSWRDVEKEIGKLIANDDYLSEKERKRCGLDVEISMPQFIFEENGQLAFVFK